MTFFVDFLSDGKGNVIFFDEDRKRICLEKSVKQGTEICLSLSSTCRRRFLPGEYGNDFLFGRLFFKYMS